jgi:hypothetical protein
MSGSVNGVRREDDHGVWGSPAFIERDQFVYFVTLARELGDPADWPGFRDELVSSLDAAWGLDTIWLHLAPDVQQRRTVERLRRAYALVDQVRARHDPLTDWGGFFDALWDGRGPLREDG